MKFAFVCLSVVLFVTGTFCEDVEQNDVPNESEFTDANTSPRVRKASEKRYLLDGRLTRFILDNVAFHQSLHFCKDKTNLQG